MKNRLEHLEPLSFLLTFTALSLLFAPCLAALRADAWGVLFFEMLVAGVAFELSELLAAALVGECDLPRVERVDEPPPVAVLFLVCDDLVPLALARLGGQDYPRADVFILDDSADEATRRAVDGRGFRVVRRQGRAGAKAGSLNEWLRRHGRRYKYFLVLDSDSLVPADFVGALVRYAEHPANARVAIFNTLSECWNTHLRFPRMLATLTPLQHWLRLRLANRAPCVLSTGHNNLHRTAAVAGVGGFDESYVAEDIAVTLRLVRAGYTSRLVNLRGYEAEPEHIFSYVGRLARWAKQNLQIHRADWRATPFSLRFQMLRLTWWYLSFFLYPAWAALAVWQAGARAAGEPTLLGAALRAPAEAAPALVSYAALAALPFVAPLARLPFLLRVGVPAGLYAKYCLLCMAIGLYATPPVCRAQLAAAVSPAVAFDVTEKRGHAVTLGAILFRHWHLLAVWAVLTAALWRNGVAPSLAALWLTTLLLAPLVIYRAHAPCAPGARRRADSFKGGADLE